MICTRIFAAHERDAHGPTVKQFEAPCLHAWPRKDMTHNAIAEQTCRNPATSLRPPWKRDMRTRRTAAPTRKPALEPTPRERFAPNPVADVGVQCSDVKVVDIRIRRHRHDATNTSSGRQQRQYSCQERWMVGYARQRCRYLYFLPSGGKFFYAVRSKQQAATTSGFAADAASAATEFHF